MNNNSWVSVIIPVYNRAMYISECIDSVHKQTYRPIELIVVDDGSTDNSIAIVKKYQTNLQRDDFKIILLEQKNTGAPRARNYGFENANGTYIQWLDSDDLLLPNKIASQVDAFTEDLDVIYSRAQFFEEKKNNLLDKYWGHIPKGDSSDYFEFPWQTMCALYKKTVLRKYGVWREDLSLADDWELAMRYKIKANVKFLNEVSSLYRSHDGERVGNNWSVEKINSLSKVLISTYKLSLKKGLIDEYLRGRYKKRLIYCVINYGALRGVKERKDLIEELEKLKLNGFLIKLMSFFSGVNSNRLLLKIYNKLSR